jgi:hypothetical protein
MASFLANRGFGWDVIGKVLGRLREARRGEEDQSGIDDPESEP